MDKNKGLEQVRTWHRSHSVPVADDLEDMPHVLALATPTDIERAFGRGGGGNWAACLGCAQRIGDAAAAPELFWTSALLQASRVCGGLPPHNGTDCRRRAKRGDWIPLLLDGETPWASIVAYAAVCHWAGAVQPEFLDLCAEYGVRHDNLENVVKKLYKSFDKLQDTTYTCKSLIEERG